MRYSYATANATAARAAIGMVGCCSVRTAGSRETATNATSEIAAAKVSAATAGARDQIVIAPTASRAAGARPANSDQASDARPRGPSLGGAPLAATSNGG